MASMRSAFTFFIRSRAFHMASITPILRTLPRIQPHQFTIHKRHYDYDSKLGPSQPFFEKESLLFHPKSIMKHIEVIPIILIAGIGLLCEIAAWCRIAATRDDVYWTKMPAACEMIHTSSSPVYKQPIRKFVVYNQKYQTPKGLLLALQGDGAGECPMEEPAESLDWYLIMGRFIPWIVWALFLYIFDLF